jgi:hypothetical protein
MVLTNEQYEDFINTHLKMLYYAGLKTGELRKNSSFENFIDSSRNTKFKCREKLNDNPAIIDDYLDDYAGYLTKNEKKIVEGFKHKITGDFVLFKYLKYHAIFIHQDTSNFYAVKALADRFDEMLPDLPVLIRATILPFENFIIYDGFIQSYRLIFGPGLRSDLKEAYRRTRAEKRIIKRIQ